MSSDDNLDEEILALAGATQKKRKQPRQGTSSKSKRRRPEHSDSSDGDAPESEDGQAEYENKYPLENLYRDELERERLLSMSEVDREAILAERREERQRMEDKRQVDAMLQARMGGLNGDSVSKAAKRQHAVRGATKEKTKKLDELKAMRKAKDEKRSQEPSKRDRSSSPMDMETDDDDEEDGQIGREEQEEERERRLLGGVQTKISQEDQPMTMEDLKKVWLTRDLIAKFCMTPWFEEYIKGAYVRYLIGQEGNQPVYRVCEIQSLSVDLVKPYKINDQVINQEFDLKHGQAVKTWPMDRVSNTMFTEREFDRLVRTCNSENVRIPGRVALDKKAAQMVKLSTQTKTESDVNAILERRNAILQGTKSHSTLIMERTRLQQARNHAAKHGDRLEMAELDKQLAALESSLPKTQTPVLEVDDVSARLAKVNERNRKANLDAVRRFEQAEAERKRKERERKLASGTATPTKGPASRTGTPIAFGSPIKTPAILLAQSDDVLPLPAMGNARGKDLQARVLETIDIDLGDF